MKKQKAPMKAKGKLLKTMIKGAIPKKKGTPKLIKTLKVPKTGGDVSSALKGIKNLSKKSK